MQHKESANTSELQDRFRLVPEGRLIAIDPGTKRVGLAVCDELRITTRPLQRIDRTSWKALLARLREVVREFDAVAVVVGLPLESDGSESEMSAEARDIARKLSLSLEIPIFLQDERVSSYEAKGELWRRGVDLKKTRDRVDSEAAAIILTDFLGQLKENGGE